MKTRIPFLISLIFHAVLALILGVVLLENPQEKAKEFVTVDISKSVRRIVPTKRVVMRESIPILRDPTAASAKNVFQPLRSDQSNIRVDMKRKPDISEPVTTLPELATSAHDLRSRFDMKLPRASGAAMTKPGTGTRQSADSRGNGTGTVGLSGEGNIFETALYWIARNITGKNKTGKEDIVFLIDASGSMEENIAAVARYINRMIDIFKESNLDYTMGVIRFNRVLKDNDIKVYEQTKDAGQIRAILRSIRCDGDERTLDALEVGLTQVKFRRSVDKTFILVTDEAFTPRTTTRQTRKELGLKDMLILDFQEILRMCRDLGVKVNVLGIDDEMHKSLSKETEGLWFEIPQPESVP